MTTTQPLKAAKDCVTIDRHKLWERIQSKEDFIVKKLNFSIFWPIPRQIFAPFSSLFEISRFSAILSCFLNENWLENYQIHLITADFWIILA